MHGNNTRNPPEELSSSQTTKYTTFFLQQNQRTRGWNRLFLETAWGWVVVAQIMYIHVSKCKNNKIKFLKNEEEE
jgi:hypothetical protein